MRLDRRLSALQRLVSTDLPVSPVASLQLPLLLCQAGHGNSGIDECGSGLPCGAAPALERGAKNEPDGDRDARDHDPTDDRVDR